MKVTHKKNAELALKLRLFFAQTGVNVRPSAEPKNVYINNSGYRFIQLQKEL